MKLRIRCKSPVPPWEVSLDDLDISNSLRELSLNMIKTETTVTKMGDEYPQYVDTGGEPAEVTLRLRLDGIDVDAETLVVLETELRRQSEEGV